MSLYIPATSYNKPLYIYLPLWGVYALQSFSFLMFSAFSIQYYKLHCKHYVHIQFRTVMILCVIFFLYCPSFPCTPSCQDISMVSFLAFYCLQQEKCNSYFVLSNLQENVISYLLRNTRTQMIKLGDKNATYYDKNKCSEEQQTPMFYRACDWYFSTTPV